MKLLWNHKIVLTGTAMMIGMALASCGKVTVSTLSSSTQQNCIATAQGKRSSSYENAEKSYDYAMAGCQQLANDEQYLVYAKCSNAAEKARRSAKAEADRNFELDKQACTEPSGE